jgi:hypothetical protein
VKRGINRLFTAVILTAILAGNAGGIDDFGYTDYYGEAATITIPTGYVAEIEESGLGTKITRFTWDDAYMRDFRVTLIEKTDSGTLAELMFVNEGLLNAKNRIAAGKVTIGETLLSEIGADEGYQGEYIVEETAGEYYNRKTLYLGKGDKKYLLDVTVHTGKLEGGLEIVQKIIGSFKLGK